MTKSKQQKQVERRKAYERQRNLARYQPRPKYVLHVKDGANWKQAMKFFSWQEVEAHRDNTEDLRKRNAADIVEGVVADAKTGKTVLRIAPHKMSDPAFVGFQAPPEGIQTEIVGAAGKTSPA